MPKSTDSVTISCKLKDETAPAGADGDAFLARCDDDDARAFSRRCAMTGDWDGKFLRDARAEGELAIVEFYVSASDGANTRTWPAPTTEGQNANCQYQVDNEVLNATDSYYRLVLTAAENTAFNRRRRATRAATGSSTRRSSSRAARTRRSATAAGCASAGTAAAATSSARCASRCRTTICGMARRCST